MAVVVAMAVPVMALVGGSSEKSTNDIVVSIEDADSFGGSGYHGGEAAQRARVASDARDFVPGADMGVGFPLEGEGEEEAVETAQPMVNPNGLPRFYAGATGSSSRSGGGGSGTGPIVAPSLGGSAAGVNLTGSGDNRPIYAATPERARHEFAFLQDTCTDPTVIASIEARQDYLRDHTDVVASGR